jgi:hypothetical protein
MSQGATSRCSHVNALAFHGLKMTCKEIRLSLQVIEGLGL